MDRHWGPVVQRSSALLIPKGSTDDTVKSDARAVHSRWERSDHLACFGQHVRIGC